MIWRSMLEYYIVIFLIGQVLFFSLLPFLIGVYVSAGDLMWIAPALFIADCILGLIGNRLHVPFFETVEKRQAKYNESIKSN